MVRTRHHLAAEEAEADRYPMEEAEEVVEDHCWILEVRAEQVEQYCVIVQALEAVVEAHSSSLAVGAVVQLVLVC